MGMEPLTTTNYRQVIHSIISNRNLDAIEMDKFMEKVESGLAEEISVAQLAQYISEVAASMISIHPQFDILAASIMIYYLHQITLPTFSEKFSEIQRNKNILHESKIELVKKYAKEFDSIVDYSRDYELSYFSVVSLIKSYLIKIGQNPIERPQDVFLREAIQIHHDNIPKVKQTYELLSKLYYTHGTPTMYNACFKKAQLSSCFLLGMKSDTIQGIFETIKDMAMLSKFSGG